MVVPVKGTNAKSLGLMVVPVKGTNTKSRGLVVVPVKGTNTKRGFMTFSANADHDCL